MGSFFGAYVVYPIYSLFNFFYSQSLYWWYKKHIQNAGDQTQFFFAGRKDFGTHIYVLHYLRLWKASRRDVSLLLFTNEPQGYLEIAKHVLPDTQVVYPSRVIDFLMLIFFGHYCVFHWTMLPVYYRLSKEHPNFLHMFDLAEVPTAQYCKELDPVYKNDYGLSSDFVETYYLVREQFDYQWDVFKDCCALNYETPSSRLKNTIDAKPLLEALGVKNPFVILNVNIKQYPPPSDRRTIWFPERYESIIDKLIGLGYDVVIQGRSEQPVFKERKGLFNYCRSSHCSLSNDLALYTGCSFVVSSKSGVEIFATMCDVPVLGLNYTEILGIQPAKRFRFFPKGVQKVASGHVLTWQEHITSPQFFEIGMNTYGEACTYIDMTEKQMHAALDEFLMLVNEPEEKWLEYTDQQKTFKNMLTPLHMELYHSQGVPSDVYLSGI